MDWLPKWNLCSLSYEKQANSYSDMSKASSDVFVGATGGSKRAFGRLTASLGLWNRPMGWIENAESMFEHRCWGLARKDDARHEFP